jgi:hypothetical protein
MTFDRLVQVEEIAPRSAYRVFAARHQCSKRLILIGVIARESEWNNLTSS